MGANLFFPHPGAQLETAGISVDDELLDGWRARIGRARAHLDWHMPGVAARRHARGASLALAAPSDQLFLATEVNEWALCATLLARDSERWSGLEAALRAQTGEDPTSPDPVFAPALREYAAFERFSLLQAREARSDLSSLIAEAQARSLPHVLDDTTLTLGAGVGGETFELAALPEASAVPWSELRDIPTALVTGSNGKTTSVRLLAACARAQGWPAAYCCTDGVFFDGALEASGDYSGPAGARRVIRERRAQAAILETARGGILRRGIAVSQAHVALVTNVSPDHFGEYGIDDLAGLADVKLSVAGVVKAGGLLVLNADDAELRLRAGALAQRFGRPPTIGWFALDADHRILTAHRSQGGATCGVRAGRLVLHHSGAEHDLGAVAAMPLSVEGSATYNVANLAGAALSALALGIDPRIVAAVFARFGAEPDDNFGRLMRFERHGVRVLVDYAHNPEGLRGLLEVARHVRGGRGRLGLLLGHAGNRQDAEIEALARVAAEFHPDLIVVKENEGHLRGREPGEIPRLIRSTLLSAGFPESVLPLRMSEFEAARFALDWAQPGDVLALPVHSAAARAEVLAFLAQK
ncbi:MAG TPA: Mur ligase family protein [Steroidobacteraceae bacterium]|nr:Mur ligase family protein [Steroidobacteraceae bacterium]